MSLIRFSPAAKKRKLLLWGWAALAVFSFGFGSLPIVAQNALRKALDYDGDQKVDAAVFRLSDNTWYVQKSSGGYIFQPFGVASSDILVPGDYDGDGKGDIAVWRDTTGVFYYLRSSDATFVSGQWGVTDDEPVARDYDGDGKTDLCVVRRAVGAMTWYILRSSDAQVTESSFGLAADYIAPGDYDGDGKFDVAIYRPSPNNGPAIFHVLGSQIGYFAFQFGSSNDLVAPGDYDGDGKTDFAIVRDTGSALEWWIRNSSNGTVFALTYGLGGGSDFPVQGDYDGDGKSDVAVWRGGAGIYYILRSSDSINDHLYWGSDGDYPVAYYDIH